MFGIAGNTEANQMSKWIDKEDSMPEQEDADVTINVLLYLSPDMLVSGFYSQEDNEWYDFDGDLVDDVTHWMPLPEFTL